MKQTEFVKLRISEREPGYYSGCLLRVLDWIGSPDVAERSEYVRDMADILLARAQLAECNRRETTAEEFLGAFNLLAEARARVEANSGN